MQLLKVNATALIAALFVVNCARAEKALYCYYGSWSTYRSGAGAFKINNLQDAKGLCTHLAYSFFLINLEYSAFLDFGQDKEGILTNIKDVMDLKKIQPNLKILMAVGGYNDGSKKYSVMASNSANRAIFINSVVKLMDEYGFDGLDLDWEYPAQNGGATEDKANYVTLLKELHDSFNYMKKLLVVACAAAEFAVLASYNIKEIEKYVDFINVMTYDLGGFWDGVIGFNAPLSGPSQFTVQKAMNFWLSQVNNREKILLGIPLYGRTFSARSYSVGSASDGAGTAGPYTNEAGLLGYNEICEAIGNPEGTWIELWNNEAQVPYAYKSDVNDYQWVGYDNVKSVTNKVEYLKAQNLGGAMVWSIDTDDFLGRCKDGKYPLLRAIKYNL